MIDNLYTPYFSCGMACHLSGKGKNEELVAREYTNSIRISA